jgi:hypothetical protein
MSLSPAAAQVTDVLADRANAVEPARFPRDSSETARPGMYSWWADEVARSTLGEEIDAALPAMLYVGQAGATKWPSGKRSSAT